MTERKLSGAERDTPESGDPLEKEHTPQQQDYKRLVEHLYWLQDSNIHPLVPFMALQGYLVALRYLAHRIVSPLDLLAASLPFVVLCCYFNKKGYPENLASAMKKPVPALFESWNEWFRDRNMHPLFLILLLGYLLMVAEYCAGVMQMILTMYMFFCLVFSGISMCAVLGKYGLRNFSYGLLALILTLWAAQILLPPQS